ncbi:unnamed protein product, partial [Linum tenue]
ADRCRRRPEQWRGTECRRRDRWWWKGVEHVDHWLKRVAAGGLFYRGVDEIRLLRDLLVVAGVPRCRLLIVRVHCWRRRRSHDVGSPFLGVYHLLPC